MAKPSSKLKFGKGQEVDDLDAQSLLDKVANVVRMQQSERLVQALRNERWYHGDQWSDLDEGYDEENMTWGEWDDRVPKLEHNIIGNTARTMVARILEMQPVTYYYPVPGGGGTHLVARACNRVLEHYNQVLKRQDKQRDVVLHALLQGAAGLKPYWDPNRGTFTESADPDGDIGLDVVYLTDSGTDGARDVANSKWCYFTKMIDRHDAVAMLLEAGYSKQEAREAVFEAPEDGDRDAIGDYVEFSVVRHDQRAIRASEIWWTPGSLFPEGLYLAFIGDRLVENMPFPYAHNELPLAYVRYVPRRGSTYGSTPFDSMVKLQRMYNEVLSVQARRLWEYRFNWVWADERVIQQMKDNNLWVARSSDDDKKPEVINANAGTEHFDKILEFLEQKIAELAGLPPVLESGQGFTGSTPGKTIAYINLLVQQKAVFTLGECFAANARVDRQILELVQENFAPERLVRLLGEGSEHMAEAFLMADLDGYSVQAEAAAGAQLSRANIAASAADAVAQGTLDPMVGGELMQTGLGETEAEAWHVSQIGDAVATILDGGAAEMDPMIDPAIAVRELSRLIPVYRNEPGVDGLVDMLRFYQQQTSAPAGPAALAAPQPPNPTGQPVGPAGLPAEVF